MIQFITGPMFAFKSSELFRYIEKAHFAKKNIILIRPQSDRDYFSHSPAVDDYYNKFDIKTLRISSYEDLYEEELNCLLKEKYDSVFIDEAFMIKDIHKIATVLGNLFDITFAGLLASSENVIFPEVAKFLPYCDKIIKLNGICMDCGSKYGNYSYYIGDKKKTTDVLVGDKDYLCLCNRCRENRDKEKGIC